MMGLSAVEIDPVTGEQMERDLAPINVIIDAALVRNEGLRIWSVEFTSEFASLWGFGSPTEMSLVVAGDAAQLSKYAGKFEMAFLLRADGPNISSQGEGRLAGMSFTSAEAEGYATEALLDWKGQYSTADKTITAEIGLVSGDIWASRTNKDKRCDQLWIGPTDLRATILRDSVADVLLSDGRATLGRVFLNGESPVENPMTLEWSHVEFFPTDGRLAASEIRLDGEDLLTVSARSGEFDFSEEPRIQGIFEVTGDLARCLAAAQPFADWEKVPPFAGVVSWNGEAATGPDRITASGRISAEDLTIGSGERTLRQDQIVVEHETILNLKENVLKLGRLSLSSQPLSLDLAGTIDKVMSDFIMDLSGSYQTAWDEVTPLLDSAAPGLSKEIGLALAGISQSDIRITGAANQPKLQPTFRGMTTNNVRLDWTSAKLGGLKLGPPVDFKPMLSDGKLALGLATIPLSRGTLKLNGVLDFTEKTPAFRVDGQLQLIEEAEITRTIGQQLLSRINPIFGQVTSTCLSVRRSRPLPPAPDD